MKTLRLQRSSKKGLARTMVAKWEGRGVVLMPKSPQEWLCHAQPFTRNCLWESWPQQGCGRGPRRTAAGAVHQLVPIAGDLGSWYSWHHSSQKCGWAHPLLPSQAEVGLSSYIFNLPICTQPCFRKLPLEYLLFVSNHPPNNAFSCPHTHPNF